MSKALRIICNNTIIWLFLIFCAKTIFGFDSINTVNNEIAGLVDGNNLVSSTVNPSILAGMCRDINIYSKIEVNKVCLQVSPMKSISSTVYLNKSNSIKSLIFSSRLSHYLTIGININKICLLPSNLQDVYDSIFFKKNIYSSNIKSLGINIGCKVTPKALFGIGFNNDNLSYNDSHEKNNYLINCDKLCSQNKTSYVIGCYYIIDPSLVLGGSYMGLFRKGLLLYRHDYEKCSWLNYALLKPFDRINIGVKKNIGQLIAYELDIYYFLPRHILVASSMHEERYYKNYFGVNCIGKFILNCNMTLRTSISVYKTRLKYDYNINDAMIVAPSANLSSSIEYKIFGGELMIQYLVRQFKNIDKTSRVWQSNISVNDIKNPMRMKGNGYSLTFGYKRAF